jgi:hypothetical protein
VDISYCQKPYLAQNHGLDGWEGHVRPNGACACKFCTC